MVEEGSDEWMQRSLNLLVDPINLTMDWADIVLRPQVKESMLQLVDHWKRGNSHQYGILKRAHLGGALLYGPPGTGKTQLVRILAKASGTPVMCATAADLQQKYVGESEQSIQGLFRLGRLLHPCIVFIDEAESLFGVRKSDDHSWERNTKNQFLLEMDGLTSDDKQPLVILATNLPGNIDNAALRRLSTRLHIGLPNMSERLQLLQHCVRDEILEEGVSLSTIAADTEGYSRSDLHSLSEHAAMDCKTCTTDPDPKRILQHTDFQEAIRRCSPSVSQGSLAAILRLLWQLTLQRWTQWTKMPWLMVEARRKGSTQSAGQVACHVRTSSIRNRWERGVPKTLPLVMSTYKALSDLSKTMFLTYNALSLQEYFQKHKILMPASNESKIGKERGRSADEYRYTPLEPDSSQIRVLRVLPRRTAYGLPESDTIRCTLETVNLDDVVEQYSEVEVQLSAEGLPKTPACRIGLWYLLNKQWSQQADNKSAKPIGEWEAIATKFFTRIHQQDVPSDRNATFEARYKWGDYIALSYAWGSQKETRDILLDGHCFKVGLNLYRALWNLRTSLEVRQMNLFVWVDAICINQADLAERAVELKKMGKIYLQCLYVRAWIGQPPPVVELEVQEARDFLESVMEFDGPRKVEELTREPDTAYALSTAASSIAAATYWQRLWILQEVALGPFVLFWYGQQYFTAQELQLLFVAQTSLGLRTGCQADRPVDYVGSLVGYLRRAPDILSQAPLDMSAITQLARRSQATDSRDKVYGLLALLPAELAARIHPNYTPANTVPETFIDFSKKCFLASGNLGLLARSKRGSLRHSDLPSWAIDLHTLPEGPNWASVRDLEGRRDHQSHQGLQYSSCSFFNHDRLLTCDGVDVGSIAVLGAIHARHREFETVMETEMDGIPPDLDCPHYNAKRAIARVMLENGDLELSGGPSVLDIPWLAPDPDRIEASAVDPDLRDTAEGVSWHDFYWSSGFGAIHFALLHGNRHLIVNGKPLKSYFVSDNEVGSDPRLFRSIAAKVYGHMVGRRLFLMQDGLLGSGPPLAQLGDRIMVLAGCDMPLVLRAKGAHYELIGGCFVNGWMKGEAGAAVKSGKLELEHITLC